MASAANDPRHHHQQQQQVAKDAADQNFDYMFKLLIIGNSSVGKTSFLFRYSDDSFTSSFVSTVGIDFKVKTVYQQDKRIKLQIWVRIHEQTRICPKSYLCMHSSVHVYAYIHTIHSYISALMYIYHYILPHLHSFYSFIFTST